VRTGTFPMAILTTWSTTTCIIPTEIIVMITGPFPRGTSDESAGSVQLLPGHTKLESAVRYLGIEVDDALEVIEQA
jgi:hypothetical protein